MGNRGKIWVPPPNWPAPPTGWEPPPHWQPDPEWGPAPEGWQFWQKATPTAPAPPPAGTDDEPGAAWDPTRVYWAKKLANKTDTLTAALTPKLGPGEQVLAVVRTIKVNPMRDLLIFTNARVLIALTADLKSKAGFPTTMWAGNIVGIDMPKREFEVLLADGSKVGLGNIDSSEHDTVRAVLAHLIANPPSPDLQAGTEAADTLIGFTPPSAGEAHRGHKVKDTTFGLATAPRRLLPGEHVTAVFSLSLATTPADVLIFTNARLIGARQTRAPGLTHHWAVLAHNLVALDLSSKFTTSGKITLTLTPDQAVDIGSARTPDTAALDYYGADMASLEVPVDLERAAAAAYLPLPADARASDPSAVGVRPSEPGVVPTPTPVVAGEGMPPSEAALAAIADGFPEKYASLVGPILVELDAAVVACDAGDIVTEEAHLARALHIARGAGLVNRRKAREWVGRQILGRATAGRVRRGVEVIGVIGESLQVFNDRIMHKDQCYVLDGDVTASVEVDGHVLESSRPTMTRMALGSVLPGSALIVGMALPKKTREDTRTANFIIVHPRWRIVEPLDPDAAGSTRGVAAQINAIATSQGRQAIAHTQQQAVDAISSVAATSGVDSQLDQLERIAAMEAAGTLTADQAASMRARVLGE